MKISPYVLTALLAFAALPARAEVIEIYDDHGGPVADDNLQWAVHGRQGTKVRVTGPCQSACTLLLGHIPRDRICVTPQASFGFQLASLPQVTATLWRAYPTDIKAWISAQGGLTRDFVWLQAPDTYRFFRPCERLPGDPPEVTELRP